MDKTAFLKHAQVDYKENEREREKKRENGNVTIFANRTQRLSCV